MSFSLNERLAGGGIDFGKHGLCRVLLKNNATFPWFILVPEVDDHIIELHQLDSDDYDSVMHSIREVSEFVESHFKPDKINVAAIGNVVPQLHIHVVARYEKDPAWPDVIWGYSEKKAYKKNEIATIQKAYQSYTF